MVSAVTPRSRGATSTLTTTTRQDWSGDFSASSATDESSATGPSNNSHGALRTSSAQENDVAIWRKEHRQKGYKPQLRSTDLLNPDRLYIGSKRHVQIVDLLACIWNEQDEDLVTLLAKGWSQGEIAKEFGVDRSTISDWIRQLKDHAERA